MAKHSADLVISGGRIIDPALGFGKEGHVFITNGCIDAVEGDTAAAKKRAVRAAETIDAAGQIVVPGLIDCHVHLREPGREDAETIESGCHAAAAGGFTTVCCMPNTTPRIDNQETVKFVQDRAKTARARVYVVGAITKNLDGKELAEIGDLVKMGAVAITDDGHYVQNPEIMRRALEYSKMFDIPVMDHAEDQYLVAGGVMNEGYESTRLGISGATSAAEEIAIERDVALCRMTGARLHIQHVSTARGVEAIRRAKEDGVRVTCEACPHHFILTDSLIGETFNTALRVNPPLRTQADVDAIIEGLVDGTIDVIASDHAPHSAESKDVVFDDAPPGMIGLELTLSLVKTYLIDKGYLTWAEAIRKMTTVPAMIFKLPHGTLEPGSEADITIIDPERKWTVKADGFHSKSSNSPFIGKRLVGRVTRTLLSGREVFAL